LADRWRRTDRQRGRVGGERLRQAAQRRGVARDRHHGSLDLRGRHRRIGAEHRSDDLLAPLLTVEASTHLNDSLSR
jgi:hypothetical protein